MLRSSRRTTNRSVIYARRCLCPAVLRAAADLPSDGASPATTELAGSIVSKTLLFQKMDVAAAAAAATAVAAINENQ